MTRATLLAGAGLVLAVGSAHADAPRPAAPAAPAAVERSRLEIQPAGRAFTELQIENPLGDVRIEGYEGTALQIEARKHAPDQDALDRLRISLIPNPDGSVRITTTADGGLEDRQLGRSAVRIDLVIRAPRDARIDAAVTAGLLELANMDAGGELDTASGKIVVRNVQGEVSTHTVSGATRLQQVFGSVDAQAVSANVDLDSITGERLVASAHGGAIAGRRVRSRQIELTTVSGKIVLEGELAARGRIAIASMRGDVEVRLRRAGTGGVRVRGRGARVDLGVPVARDAHAQLDGWVEAQLAGTRGAAASGPPALVELRSRGGLVSFAIVE